MTCRLTAGVVAGLAFAIGVGAEPVPLGVLGQTEPQLAAKFGPPDPAVIKQYNLRVNLTKAGAAKGRRPWEAEFLERDSRLKDPVVRQVWYAWKKFTVASPFADI